MQDAMLDKAGSGVGDATKDEDCSGFRGLERGPFRGVLGFEVSGLGLRFRASEP